jgi:hypothetical protein
MYEWTEPHEDEYTKEQIEELRQAQKNAVDHGRILLSSYEHFWLPVLNDLPDVEYTGRQSYSTPYGTIEAAMDAPFHGALWLTPASDTDLPPALKSIKEWMPATAVVDMNARMVMIQVEEIEVTFTGINLSLNAHQLLGEVNRELVRVNAGLYVWSIEPVVETVLVDSERGRSGRCVAQVRFHVKPPIDLEIVFDGSRVRLIVQRIEEL